MKPVRRVCVALAQLAAVWLMVALWSAGCSRTEPSKSAVVSASEAVSGEGSAARRASEATRAARPPSDSSGGTASSVVEKRHRPDSVQPISTAPDDSAVEVAEYNKPATEGRALSLGRRVEALLLEATQLELKPLPSVDDPELLRLERRRRNQKIVDLCSYAATLAHDKPQLQSLFDAAVHRLVNALLELALQGDADAAESLYAFSEALYEREPSSRAAADAAYTLVKLAFKSAELSEPGHREWVREYARQARLFASRFPNQPGRAAAALFGAGRSCEVYGLLEEARACYTQLQADFPHTAQAAQSTGILRRLDLPGKRLELAGPTLNGVFFEMSQVRGRPVVVVLWSTTATEFLEHLAELNAACRARRSNGLTVVSVCFDTDDSLAQRFVQRNEVDWTVLFYSDPKERGWNNPVATYYGVWRLPQVWLVGRDGRVVATEVRWHELEAKLDELVVQP